MTGHFFWNPCLHGPQVTNQFHAMHCSWRIFLSCTLFEGTCMFIPSKMLCCRVRKMCDKHTEYTSCSNEKDTWMNARTHTHTHIYSHARSILILYRYYFACQECTRKFSFAWRGRNVCTYSATIQMPMSFFLEDIFVYVGSQWIMHR